MNTPPKIDTSDTADYTAAIERALKMADVALCNLVAAYEHDDMESVKKMLANMSQRRSLVIANPVQPANRQLALH